MIQLSKIITGGSHEDLRGTLRYFNEFNLLPIKRFYISEHKDTITVKAWQAHKKERKWFYVTEGSFKIVLVKIFSWEEPHLNSKYEEYVISANEHKILCIPEGFATGFQALLSNSKVMVFSDFTLEESLGDDIRFNKDLWYKW